MRVRCSFDIDLDSSDFSEMNDVLKAVYQQLPKAIEDDWKAADSFDDTQMRIEILNEVPKE